MDLLGHATEMIEEAVLLPHGHYVQFADPLFERHGLGARYARVQTSEVGNRVVAYACLDLVDPKYNLATGAISADLFLFADLRHEIQRRSLTTGVRHAE